MMSNLLMKKTTVVEGELSDSLRDVEFPKLLGGTQTFDKEEMFANAKVIMFVNVACKCGYTGDHYEQLGYLDQKYRARGLRILCFPCRQFAHQEFEKDSEIEDYVKNKLKSSLTLFTRIDVNGPQTHPVYKWLKMHSKEFTSKKGELDNIGWNFGKFVVLNGETGPVMDSYVGPKTSPKEMEAMLMKHLPAL